MITVNITVLESVIAVFFGLNLLTLISSIIRDQVVVKRNYQGYIDEIKSQKDFIETLTHRVKIYRARSRATYPAYRIDAEGLHLIDDKKANR